MPVFFSLQNLSSIHNLPLIILYQLLTVASGALGRKVLRAARCKPVLPDAHHGYCSRWSTQLFAVICDLSVSPPPYPAIPTLPCPLCSSMFSVSSPLLLLA